MKQNKKITKLFEGYEIRSIWNSVEEDYYFSVVSSIPKNYWTDLKAKLVEEGNKLYDKIVQLK
jgi:hypothetical protein